MPKLKVLSGSDVVKIFFNFGFIVFSQKGSHIKLRREVNGAKQTLVIPNHKEIDKGTLSEIVKQSSKYISPEDLQKEFHQ
jgi:predicted RNA binding protein YcfA (HicA-like mRNA interferase family)